MNLELQISVVRGRIQLRPYEKGTKVNVRTFRDGITLTITKTQIDKHHKRITSSLPFGRTGIITIESSWFSVRVREQG